MRRRRRKSRDRVRGRAQRLGVAAITAGSFVPSASEATTFLETSLEHADFANTFAQRDILPDGTDVVIGDMFDTDHFAVDDLVAGESFSITLEVGDSSSSGGRFSVTDETRTSLLVDELGSPILSFFVPEFSSTIVSGTIPASGQIAIQVQSLENSYPYVVTIDAPRLPVPEPGSAALVGAGLLALGARRRR